MKIFAPPTEEQRLGAIGSMDDVPEQLKPALDVEDFEPLSAPETGDWLDVHPEPGQPFDEFIRSHANRPGGARTKVYLQPLGRFPDLRIPLLDLVGEFAGVFFQLDVETLPVIDLDNLAVTTRINPLTQNVQLLTSDMLELLKRRLPRDAFCLVGITMKDLYPEPTWNFVFGQASLYERVGVYSFARYDPLFFGEPRGDDYENILLRRSCKVLAHETGHMFGITHCVYFRCAMNGSNHLMESDMRPMHLCPVCLRKLHHSIRFDTLKRYDDLLAFYMKTGIADETRWLEYRLRKLQLGASV